MTTLYVPAMPGGELARKLQKAQHKYSDIYQVGWTKMVERGGTKLKDLVGNKYPGQRSHVADLTAIYAGLASTSQTSSHHSTNPRWGGAIRKGHITR